MLNVQQLSIDINGKIVVDNSSFTARNGEITTIVGESGSGKSMTISAVLNTLPKGSKITGEIVFLNQVLTKMKAEEVNELRRKFIFTIFQDATNSFNPSVKMEKQLYAFSGERLGDSVHDFRVKMKRILEELDLTRHIFNHYPFELSGGMLQRCMIACALYVEPQLLIADEPTSSLDMLVQKECITLLKRLNEAKRTTIILITHDIDIVREVADEVVVMKAGKIVEKGHVEQIFERPEHGYTKRLLQNRFE